MQTTKFCYSTDIVSRKSRHNKSFGAFSQYTRNWSRSSGGTSLNYQGVFLRGYGGQTSYHYGAVGHWSAGLGELQGDGIREICLPAFSTGGQHGIGGASGSFGVTGGQGYDWKYGGTGNTYWGGINFYASRVTPVVGEIRPVNRAVRYLIRAR